MASSGTPLSPPGSDQSHRIPATLRHLVIADVLTSLPDAGFSETEITQLRLVFEDSQSPTAEDILAALGFTDDEDN